MSLYIAAYDIEDQRRRTRVARALIHYGQRIQESVFEVWIDPDDMSEFRCEVGALLSKADCFDLYPIDQRPDRPRLSWQRETGGRQTTLSL
jgi:CRISPR-associated protein Cas2